MVSRIVSHLWDMSAIRRLLSKALLIVSRAAPTGVYDCYVVRRSAAPELSPSCGPCSARSAVERNQSTRVRRRYCLWPPAVAEYMNDWPALPGFRRSAARPLRLIARQTERATKLVSGAAHHRRGHVDAKAPIAGPLPVHSIILSAPATSGGGTEIPSCLAVLGLMDNSNLVTW